MKWWHVFALAGLVVGVYFAWKFYFSREATLNRLPLIVPDPNAIPGPPSGPPQMGVIQSPRTSQSAAPISDACRKVLDANTAGIKMVPDKNAQYVAKASGVLTDINCGAVKIVEQGATKVWHAITSIF